MAQLPPLYQGILDALETPGARTGKAAGVEGEGSLGAEQGDGQGAELTTVEVQPKG